jgi:hypothetical protein
MQNSSSRSLPRPEEMTIAFRDCSLARLRERVGVRAVGED